MDQIKLYDTIEILIDKTECGKTILKGTLGTVLETKNDENGHLMYLVEIASDECLLFAYKDGEIRKR